jgi:cell division protein ZipA
MDKELLRIAIIAIGASVILLMLVWVLFKNKKKQRKINFYDDQHEMFTNMDSRLEVNPDADGFDVIPLGKKEATSGTSLDPKEEYPQTVETELSTDEDGTDLNPKYMQTVTENTTDFTSPPVVEKKVLPVLLQFSLVAKQGKKFTGAQLLDAFDSVGLIFGSVQVFERLDNKNRVDYAVASMIGTGTFPNEHWETYHCPGINLFMQPRELEDASAVFENLMNTLGQLSALLDGDILDADKQPLTEGVVNQLKSNFRSLN